MPRLSAESIHRILSAHFAKYPHHWTSGTGGRVAVSAVVALTSVPAASVCEWAKTNRPASIPLALDPTTTPVPQESPAMPAPASMPNIPTPATADADSVINPPINLDRAAAEGDLVGLSKGLAAIQSEISTLATAKAHADTRAAEWKIKFEGEQAKRKEAEGRIKEVEGMLSLAPAPAAATINPGDPHRIPSIDSTHIAQAIDSEIDWSLKHRSPLLITGPTGAGKTYPVLQACGRAGRAVRRVCFDGETTSTDLLGRRDALDGRTVWTDGILPQAMEAGDVLLVDEIDRADESSRAALFSVLDSGTLFLPVPNKLIRAAPGFQLVACCNGVGDTSGQYTGTQAIDAAFLGRWTDVLRVDYPEPATEVAMIRAAVPGVPEDGAKKVAEFFQVLRKAQKEGSLAGPFSIRQSKRMAELYHLYRLEKTPPPDALARALDRTLIGRETPDNRHVIKETFQRVFGQEAAAKVKA